MPSNEGEDTDDLPVADLDDGERPAVHERACIVPSESGEADDVFTVEKRFAEFVSDPFGFRVDELFEIDRSLQICMPGAKTGKESFASDFSFSFFAKNASYIFKGGEALMTHGMIKIIGLAGMALGTIATVVSGYAQNKQMEQTIEEKVKEALEKKENEVES